MGNCCDIQRKKVDSSSQDNVKVDVIQQIQTENNYQEPPIIFTIEQQQQNKQLSIQLKEQGNQFIQKKEYLEAIKLYSQAIQLYNEDSIYFSNRAVAYRALKQYKNVQQDAEKAIQLNSENPRAYFLLGTVNLLIAQEGFSSQQADQGIQMLKKAKEILIINPKPELLIVVDYNIELGQKVIERLEYSRKYSEFLQFKEKMIQNYGDQINLNQLSFLGDKENYIPQQIEYLTCVITQDLMIEPTLLSSGHTYETCSILECTRVNGPIDPFTRKQISSIRIPNIQLKQAIEDYQKYKLEFQ